MSDLMRNPMAQLAVLIGDSSVPATYGVIMSLRCPRCGAQAGQRCTTARTGRPTPPHSARVADAVSAIAYEYHCGVD